MQLFGIVLGGILGAGLGYLLRVREWMREKRLTCYVEFVTSFFDVTRKALISFDSTEAEEDDAYNAFDHAWDRLAASRAQVAVLAGSEPYSAALNCVTFITDDIWPHLRREVAETEVERLQWKGLQLEQEFIRAASRELGPRLSWRKRHSFQRE